MKKVRYIAIALLLGAITAHADTPPTPPGGTSTNTTTNVVQSVQYSKYVFHLHYTTAYGSGDYTYQALNRSIKPFEYAFWIAQTVTVNGVPAKYYRPCVSINPNIGVYTYQTGTLYGMVQESSSWTSVVMWCDPPVFSVDPF